MRFKVVVEGAVIRLKEETYYIDADSYEEAESEAIDEFYEDAFDYDEVGDVGVLSCRKMEASK